MIRKFFYTELMIKKKYKNFYFNVLNLQGEIIFKINNQLKYKFVC